MAATRGFDNIVSRLVGIAAEQNDPAGLAINLRDSKKGMAAIHRAALRGRADCVRLLLTSEPKPNLGLRDKLFRTPLVLAYEQ
ncbi:hypothetical protein B0T24DRAFT_607287 [Lasiosphaeria ovina]|uniref:Uncharacterized protein n=1 Tax=Lasiosphaeria ovina TaxID=92902 RepID=A0AAE0NMA6_9PEZI|nr:hypothetical protein B0T24DRAFT_607287 [Lasiosphaeria ovina]